MIREPLNLFGVALRFLTDVFLHKVIQISRVLILSHDNWRQGGWQTFRYYKSHYVQLYINDDALKRTTLHVPESFRILLLQYKLKERCKHQISYKQEQSRGKKFWCKENIDRAF